MYNQITIYGWTFRLNKAGVVLGAERPNAKWLEFHVYDWNAIGFTGGDIEEIRIHLVRLNAVFASKSIGVPMSEAQKKVMQDAIEPA